MEIARKGLTRLLCLLGESKQQHQSSSKQEALWKTRCKGLAEMGLCSACGLVGREASQHNSPHLLEMAATSSSCAEALSPTGSTDRPVLGIVWCWTDSVLGVDWKPICIVWAQNFYAGPARRWLWSSVRKGRASHTRWYLREGGSTAALPHVSIVNVRKTQLCCLGSANQLQRQHRQLVQGDSSITHSHPALFKEEYWPSRLYFQGGKSWCQKRDLLRLPLHKCCCSYHEFIWVLLRDNLTNHMFFRDHKQE